MLAVHRLLSVSDISSPGQAEGESLRSSIGKFQGSILAKSLFNFVTFGSIRVLKMGKDAKAGGKGKGKAAAGGGGDEGGGSKGKGKSGKGGASDGLGTCTYVKARHILCEKQGKINEAYKKLQDGWLGNGDKVPPAEFAKLAAEYSECPSGKKGGDLGWFPRGKMAGPFQEVAFSTPIGATSAAFKSTYVFDSFFAIFDLCGLSDSFVSLCYAFDILIRLPLLCIL